MDQFARWAPTIVTVIAAIFAYGRLTARVEGHDDKLAEHEEKIELHATKLETQGIEIAKLTAWRDGYNAATTKLKG